MVKIFPVLIVILFSCITYSQKDSLELNSLNLSLKKAKVATFYSATRLNGKDEIEFAKKYTDSLEILINNSTFK